MPEWVKRMAASPWLHCLLLALPFAVGIAWLRGLTVTLPVHQGFDENLHYAATLAFVRQLPFVDLHRSYATSGGPLFYYLFGAFARVTGSELYKLRLLNVAVSYGTAVALYFMLRRTLRTPAFVSLSLAAVVAFSPYFLGQAFILLTDNLMYLWVVIALDALIRFVRRPGFASLAVFSAAAALALLTRQFAIWLLPVAMIAVWRAWGPTRERWLGLGLVAAAFAPLGVVMVAWGGPVQPGSTFMLASQSSRFSYLWQAIAVVGLYALTVVPLHRLKGLATSAIRSPLLLLLAVASIVGMELDHIPQQPFRFGWIGLVGAHYPDVAATSIVYWVLTPLGAIFLAWGFRAYRDDAVKQLAVVGLILVSLTSLASSVYYQRYVDVPILILVAVLCSGTERIHRLDYARWWLLVTTFVYSIFAFVDILPPPQHVPLPTDKAS